MHHLHVRKGRKPGSARSPKQVAVCMYMNSLKGVSSCSARCCVCIEGSKSDGPSKGEPGVSAARAVQWMIFSCCMICQITAANRRMEWGMKVESQLAPDCGNVPSAKLQGLFPWQVPALGVWASWQLVHLLPSQNTDDGGNEEEGDRCFSVVATESALKMILLFWAHVHVQLIHITVAHPSWPK